MVLNIDQMVMRRKPTAPKIAPSENPALISRFATNHQSRNFNSPSAIARITSVEACEPELPPELITSGMNKFSTIALAISSSK